MLLDRIGNNNKKLFLQLVKKVMESDNYVSEKEKELFDEFCLVLGVKLLETEVDVSEIPYENIIDDLRTGCGLAERRLIVFEIITIALADDDINEKENEVLGYLYEKFGITDNLKEDMMFFAESYLQIQEDIINLIGL